MKKEILLFLTLLFGSYATSHALKGNADFQYSADKTKTRLNFILADSLDLNGFKVNYTTITAEDELQTLASIKPRVWKTFSDSTEVSVTTKFDRKQGADNLFYVSPAFAKGGFHVEPVQTNIDEYGDMVGVDTYASFNGKVKGVNIDIAGLYLNPKQEDNLFTGFVAVDNGKFGLGASRSTEKDIGVTLAHQNKLTELLIVEYNPKTKAWHGRVYFGQNGKGALTAKGPKCWGESVVGWGENDSPYFTADGNKSKGGFVTQFRVNGTDKDLEEVLATLGRNFGTVRTTLQQMYNLKDKASSLSAIITYDFKKGLVEVKIDDTGVMGAYVNMNF